MASTCAGRRPVRPWNCAARSSPKPMLADITFEDHGGIPVARIRGEIDMSNVGELSQTLQNSVDQVAPGLVVDFSPTTYLDSAGLQFVFDLGKRLRDRGQRLLLVVPDGSAVGSV